MKVTINGEERAVDDSVTLLALVQQLGANPERVAIELNRNIVARERWQNTVLQDGDHLEMVHFVGGG